MLKGKRPHAKERIQHQDGRYGKQDNMYSRNNQTMLNNASFLASD